MFLGGKPGYEPVPDVEKGEVHSSNVASAQEKYPDLSDDQADLLFSMDEAIAGASFDLSLSKASPQDLLDQGQSFVMGIITPTLTAVSMFVAAYMVTLSAEYSSAMQVVAKAFPYINASVVFYASFRPIKKRMMAAVTPVFEAADRAKEEVHSAVGDLATTIDSTVDGLQVKMHDVVNPMKPIMEKAKAQEATLQKMDPTLDIPDLDDLDREFDEMQGLVTGKIEEALKQLTLDQYIPSYLRSAESFYWRVIFPVALLFLLIQLGLAWYSTSQSISVKATGARLLLEDSYDVDVLGYKDEIGKQISGYKEEAGQQVNEYKEEIGSKVSEMKDEFNSALHGMEESFTSQFDSTVVDLKSMAMNVAYSYAMALLQLGLTFLMTDPRVRAWVVNLLMGMLTSAATRKLRETGAVDAVQDVLGMRMAKVRGKVEKIIRTYQKVNGLLGNLGGLSSMSEQIGPGSLEKKGSLLGRLFSPTGKSPSPSKKG